MVPWTLPHCGTLHVSLPSCPSVPATTGISTWRKKKKKAVSTGRPGSREKPGIHRDGPRGDSAYRRRNCLVRNSLNCLVNVVDMRANRGTLLRFFCFTPNCSTRPGRPSRRTDHLIRGAHMHVIRCPRLGSSSRLCSPTGVSLYAVFSSVPVWGILACVAHRQAISSWSCGLLHVNLKKKKKYRNYCSLLVWSATE